MAKAKEYVEREAAKRELLSWAVCMNHPEYLMRDDAMHVIDSMPAADVVEQEQESKPTNGWISVEDRLPEKNQAVLGWYKDNPFAGYTYEVVSWNGKGWVFVYAQRYVTNVTHWMPMPEPPKTEKMEE